jgi:hypothetical protein
MICLRQILNIQALTAIVWSSICISLRQRGLLAEFQVVVWNFDCWSHSSRRSKAAFGDGAEPQIYIIRGTTVDAVKFTRWNNEIVATCMFLGSECVSPSWDTNGSDVGQWPAVNRFLLQTDLLFVTSHSGAGSLLSILQSLLPEMSCTLYIQSTVSSPHPGSKGQKNENQHCPNTYPSKDGSNVYDMSSACVESCSNNRTSRVIAYDSHATLNTVSQDCLACSNGFAKHSFRSTVDEKRRSPLQ